MGFSLVEFLIAMTIGLFLLAGMATVFSTTNISYNSQTGLAQLQNNQLLAMNMLSNVLQSAGFYTSPQTQSFAAALPGSVTQANLPGNMQLYNSANHSHVTPLSTAPGSSMSFGIGQAVAGGSLYNGGPDVVAVRAQGSTTAPIGPLDCSGATTGNLTVSVFTVSNGNLLCLTYASQTAAYPSNWLVLVNNVSSMNVYYGLDPNSTGSATEYVSAANVTAWNQVMSVRVTLTFVNTVSTNAITFTRVIGIMGML
jgi:type IV pilus assembly protein PilW